MKLFKKSNEKKSNKEELKEELFEKAHDNRLPVEEREKALKMYLQMEEADKKEKFEIAKIVIPATAALLQVAIVVGAGAAGHILDRAALGLVKKA